MKNITVFLASSDELKNDRNSFHSLVASLDEIFEPRGYRIRCRRWEDFSAFCTGSRTQDDYNRIVRASDICICMFHRKAGEYTIEEFNQALDEYVKSQSHPKTFVYIRALIEGEMEDEALKRFKEDLFDRVGHYWCNYATDDAMKLHFVMQLERIIPSVSSNASVTEGNQDRERSRFALRPQDSRTGQSLFCRRESGIPFVERVHRPIEYRDRPTESDRCRRAPTDD